VSDTLALSELYTSVQGEGPLVGKPTQFVRFGGCNMRCPLWGEHTLPDGEVVGACDTPYAVYPQYRSEWHKVTPQALVDSLPTWPKHLCITGGEPFLQNAKALETFVGLAMDEDYTFEVFTNGTLPMGDWVFAKNSAITLDYKLFGSGEGLLQGKKFTTRQDNIKRLSALDAIKFTIGTQADLSEAMVAYAHLANHTKAQFYVGAVWGKVTDAQIIDFMTTHKLDWKLNTQVHKYIFDPDARGI
jgi:7-carboxy-7-deazaguanine synthase